MLRVFLIEDSPVIRENLIATLQEMAPIDVVGWADNETAALDWLGDPRNDCDLLIVDILLRVGSGLGVLRALPPRLAEVERFVLTNYATPGLNELCHALGATRVFDKSGEIDDLIEQCALLVRRPGHVTG